MSILMHIKEAKKIILIREFLHRDTRPIFIEDVSHENQDTFDIVSGLEFPDSIESITGSKLLVKWYQNEIVNFDHIKPLLECNYVELDLANYIDEYADASDDPDKAMGGIFVLSLNDQNIFVTRDEALRVKEVEIVQAVSNIEIL